MRRARVGVAGLPEFEVAQGAPVTPKIEVARENGAVVLHESRKGYGAACLRGIARTTEDSDIIVILDGDHSDYPEDLPLLLQPLRDNKADFVIVSRVLGKAEPGSLPWNQRWGNALACFRMRWL